MQKLNKNFKSSLHFQHGNVTLKFICLSLVFTEKKRQISEAGDGAISATCAAASPVGHQFCVLAVLF